MAILVEFLKTLTSEHCGLWYKKAFQLLKQYPKLNAANLEILQYFLKKFTFYKLSLLCYHTFLIVRIISQLYAIKFANSEFWRFWILKNFLVLGNVILNLGFVEIWRPKNYKLLSTLFQLYAEHNAFGKLPFLLLLLNFVIIFLKF